MCPADIVVLDTSLIKSRENVCYVDTKIVDGKSLRKVKKAVTLTKRTYESLRISLNFLLILIVEKNSAGKDNFPEYRKRLSGKLEYMAPNRDLDKFEGTLKLKKDPKTEALTIENLILRGSVIKNTDWYEI